MQFGSATSNKIIVLCGGSIELDNLPLSSHFTFNFAYQPLFCLMSDNIGKRSVENLDKRRFLVDFVTFYEKRTLVG